MQDQANVMTFSNGLSEEDDEKIDMLRINIAQIISDISSLGPHRSYSLAVTKLEEAGHWLRDRQNKPA